MDNRALAALLSSLITQLLLLLFAIFPSNPLSSISDSHSNSNPNSFLFPQILHLLSTSELAASLSLLSRKRKRTHSNGGYESSDGQRSKLGRVSSAIPRNPDSFRAFFKMTSSTFEWLSALLEPLLECRDPSNEPLNLSADTRLGVGLFRLSTGSDYPDISRRFGVSEPVAKFCVKQFCRVLCTNFRFWVGFPNPNELESVSNSFETLTGMPNCCGIIDCTRFSFFKNKDEEESIAAQIVVDSESRILSIVAGFNGKNSDSRVLKSSNLYKDIEGGNLLNSTPIDINGVSIPQYLVGKIGYPLLPWLIVPYVEPAVDSCEERFNNAYKLMHVSGLKTIASLKNWGVLSRPVEEEFKSVVAYIGACSILHNALLMREDYSALCDQCDDYSVYGEGSETYNYRNASLEEISVEKKASEIRSALATRARNVS